MEAVSFIESLFYGLLLSSVLAFFLPTIFFLHRRFKGRFKWSICVAVTVIWFFLINLVFLVIDLNEAFLGLDRVDSFLTRIAFLIGFVGFLILFGKDINRWKSDP